MSAKRIHSLTRMHNEIVEAFEETALQYKLQHYRARYDGPFRTTRDANLHQELARCRERLAQRLQLRTHKLLPVKTSTSTTSTTVADAGTSVQVISDDLKNESLTNTQ